MGGMRHQGVVPNESTYNALISACEKANQPELTQQVSEAIQRDLKKMPLSQRVALTAASGTAHIVAYPARRSAAYLAAHPVAKPAAHPTAKPAAHRAAHLADMPAGDPADTPEGNPSGMLIPPSLSVPGLFPGLEINMTADNLENVQG